MKLELDMREAKKAVKISPEKTIDAIHRTLMEVAVHTQQAFRKNMPRGKTGQLQRSVKYHFNSKVSVTIEPTAEHAEFVEHGTRPHFPPVNAITPWAKMKGIPPWALAVSISKHGTRAHPFLEKTAREVEPYAQRKLNENLQRVIDNTI